MLPTYGEICLIFVYFGSKKFFFRILLLLLLIPTHTNDNFSERVLMNICSYVISTTDDFVTVSLKFTIYHKINWLNPNSTAHKFGKVNFIKLDELKYIFICGSDPNVDSHQKANPRFSKMEGSSSHLSKMDL